MLSGDERSSGVNTLRNIQPVWRSVKLASKQESSITDTWRQKQDIWTLICFCLFFHVEMTAAVKVEYAGIFFTTFVYDFFFYLMDFGNVWASIRLQRCGPLFAVSFFF